MMLSYDLTIVGGGIVGLTLAISLAKSDLRIAIIESKEKLSRDDLCVSRVSAINIASRTIFEKLGVWEYINASRITPYACMSVWEKDTAAKIEFSASDVNAPQLGYIIENEQIKKALMTLLEQQTNVTFYAPDKICKVSMGDGEAWLTLGSDKQLTSKLLVGADGANSWLRNQANIPLTYWDYEQDALVATIKTELAHENCARQIFTSSGPLAFLPLFEDNLCSIVWSAPAHEIDKLKALSRFEFNKQLSCMFDNRLGACELQGERLHFPLRMRYARDFAKHRIALIGDAAHTIHPLAGQGVNLGILDALSLSECIQANHDAGKDIGLYPQLRQFERWRKTEAVQMIAAMELLKRLFQGNDPGKKILRNLALLFADNILPVKKQFIRQAMGLSGELPAILNPS
ncbi:FAD-dependent monooxygenase [Psychromonas sp. CD1]|uniref:FAD-dependent monooxygenase n=1 Tax=Psychromonas sp. CD1 TaxID=1979839 RepID=UPI0035AE93CD